ncbi:WD domain-protein [Podospora conica]|nr:WD domain-protein [Schizothecium conicum]
MTHSEDDDVDSSEEDGLDGDDGDGDDDADDDDDLESDESAADYTHYHYHNPEIYHQHHHIVPHPVPYFNAPSDMDMDIFADEPEDDEDDEDGADSSLYINAVGMLTSDMDESLDTFDTTPDYHFDSLDFFGGGSPGPPYAPLMHHASLAPLAADFSNMLASLPDSMQPPPSTISLDAPTNEMAVLSEWLETAHPTAVSNPNPHTLGGSNMGLSDFLHYWARQTRSTSGLTRTRYPWPTRIHDMVTKPPKKVQYADLEGDMCDIQGINWEDLGVTRKEARERRLLTYKNYVSAKDSDRWMPNHRDMALPRTESFFRFRRMDIRNNVALSHFQLRNILAVTSRTRAFYPGIDSVYQFNPVTGETRTVMKLQSTPGSQVSTIAADHGVLMAGLFNGEYLLRRLDADELDPENPTATHHGVITTNPSGITNHVQIHASRTSSSPLAAISSNDQVFRVLDLATETILAAHEYPFSLNCSALSPDGRLRVMVGDDKKVLITTADSPGTTRPEVLAALDGHRDYGFACDWADDGWTVATGFQDKSVKIWDARRWTDARGRATPVCTVRAEMAGVRGLRFSPAGSGRRVLVAAEEADYVSVIDAQTWRAKQTVDLFGEVGGVAFSNGGQELAVLCCDQARGGVLQMERCGTGGEAVYWEEEEGEGYGGLAKATTWDWRETGLDGGRGGGGDSKTRRRRKGADMGGGLEPF